MQTVGDWQNPSRLKKSPVGGLHLEAQFPGGTRCPVAPLAPPSWPWQRVPARERCGAAVRPSRFFRALSARRRVTLQAEGALSRNAGRGTPAAGREMKLTSIKSLELQVSRKNMYFGWIPNLMQRSKNMKHAGLAPNVGMHPMYPFGLLALLASL